jgi:colanic acid biosynthesis glycosyl transferase WcaI
MVAEMAEHLAQHGHTVTVLTGWPSHPAGTLYPSWKSSFRQVENKPEGYRVVRCGHSLLPRSGILARMWYYFTFAVSTLLVGMGMGKVDAVLNLSTPIFGSWSAWLLSRIKGAGFVYTIFDLHPESAYHAGLVRAGLAYRVLKHLDTCLCCFSDRIVTLSEPLSQAIQDRGITSADIRIIPFWLDEKKIRPSSRDNSWRQARGISIDTFVCLYAGTVGYISGAEILVRVAQRLRQKGNVLILVVGEGPAKDNVRKEAEDRKLPNIRFLPFQPAEVLSDVQATAEVGMVSLLPEAGRTSIPSKVLGYMAAGRAVIASVADTSGTASMLREGDCGWVVPPEDDQAMAEAIIEAVNKPELLHRRGRNARRFFLERFSKSSCLDRYRELLLSVSREKPRREAL